MRGFLHLVGNLSDPLKKAKPIELEVKYRPYNNRIDVYTKDTIWFTNDETLSPLARIDEMYLTVDRKIIGTWDYRSKPIHLAPFDSMELNFDNRVTTIDNM